MGTSVHTTVLLVHAVTTYDKLYEGTDGPAYETFLLAMSPSLDSKTMFYYTSKFLHFSYKQCQFTKDFDKQSYDFFVPKVLRNIFYP